MATPIHTLITAQHAGLRGPLPAHVLRTPLRQDQLDTLARLRQTFHQHRRAHLVHAADAERLVLALATMLSLEVPTLLLTPSSTRSTQWQQCVHQHTEAIAELDTAFFSPDPDIPAQITCLRYHELLDHPELIDQLCERPLRTLVLDDCHHLLRPVGALVERLVERMPGLTVLGLSDGLPRPTSRHTRKRLERLVSRNTLRVDTAARVRETRLAPYAHFAWCAELQSDEHTRLGELGQALHAQIAELRPDAPPVLGLDAWLTRRFERSMLAGEGRQKSFGDLLVREPHSTVLWVRALRELHLELPAESWLLEEMKQPMSWSNWAELLLDYHNDHLVPLNHTDSHARQRLVQKILLPLGRRILSHGELQSFPAPLERLVTGSRNKLTSLLPILEQERRERTLRAVLFVGDPERSATHRFDLENAHAPSCFDAFDVAKTLHDFRRAVLTPNVFWISTSRVSEARSLLSSIDARAEARVVAEKDHLSALALASEFHRLSTLAAWAIACLERGLIECLITTPAYLDGAGAALKLTTLVDLTSDGDRGQATVHHAAALLAREGNPSTLVNIWSIFALAPDVPLGERDLEGLAARLQDIPSPSPSSHLQLGIGALHPLFLREQHPILFLQRERFNREALERASHHLDNHASWSLGSRYKAKPFAALDIFRVSSTRPALTRLPPAQAALGAETSPTRARRRRFFYLEYRRHLIAQALVFGTTGCLTLPLVAGPLLGILLAFLYLAIVTSITRRHVRNLKRIHLLAPDRNATRVLDIARVVLRTLRDCEGIRQRDLPSSLLCVEEIEPDVLRVWLKTDNHVIAHRFINALSEALNPLAAQRYIISRPITRMPLRARQLKRLLDLEIASYHPVPSLFGRSRQTAELYAGHWAQTMGPGKLRYACGGKGRLMRHIHFAQRSLGLIAHRITLWV